MAAELPYLPPIDRFIRDTAAISKGTAEDVAARTSIAGKVGAGVRGVLAEVPAGVRAVNDTLAMPARAVANTVGNFGTAVLGLPAIATPQAPAPAAAAAAAPPLQPIASVQAGTLPALSTDNPRLPVPATAAPLAATTPRMSFAYDPIAVGLRMQEHYAAGQRDAVLAAAEQAAATGNPLNATARYMAALHALPAISGSNNFGANEGAYAGQQLDVNQRERGSELNSATEQYKADTLASTARDVEASRAKSAENTAKVQAGAIRHNVQFPTIGHHLERDPATGLSVPVPDVGIATTDENGKVTVTDMQGNPLPKQGMPAVPTVGAKVKQADGVYELQGGKKATVKNGVISKLE